MKFTERNLRVRVNQRIRFPLNIGGFQLSARFLLPRLLALPTEAWQGAGRCGNDGR